MQHLEVNAERHGDKSHDLRPHVVERDAEMDDLLGFVLRDLCHADVLLMHRCAAYSR